MNQTQKTALNHLQTNQTQVSISRIKAPKSIHHHGVTLPAVLAIKLPPLGPIVPCLPMEVTTRPAPLAIIRLVLLAINLEAPQIPTQTTKHPQGMKIPPNRTTISHQVLQEMKTPHNPGVHQIQMRTHLNRTTINHQTKAPLNPVPINPGTHQIQMRTPLNRTTKAMEVPQEI